MSQRRTIKAILALDYDKRSLGATEKAIDRFNAVLDTTRKRTVALDQSADDLKKAFADLARQDALNKVSQDLAKAEVEGRDFNAALRLANEQLVKLGASQDEINAVARGFRSMSDAADAAAASAADALDATLAAQAASAGEGAARTGQVARGALGVLGTNLRGLPAVQISGQFSTDALAKIFQVIDTGLLALGPSGIATGAALVGVGLVFSKFASDLEKYNQRIEAQAKAFFTALDEAFSLIFDGATSQDIRERQAQAEADAAAAQAQLDILNDLKEGYAALQQEVDVNGIAFTQNIGGANRGRVAGRQFLEDASGGNIRTVEQLDAAYQAATVALEEANAAVDGFAVSLDSAQVAANDAAAALERRQNMEVAASVRRSEIEAETLKFLETATIESANARIEAAEKELDRLFALNEQLAAIGGETAEALILENQARIDEQVVIRETTRALMDSTVVARETAGAAIFRIFDDISDRTGQLLSAVGDTGVLANASIEIFALQAKIEDAAAKTALAIDAINKKLADAEAKALADRESGLQDAIDKAYDAREKQEIAHQDRLFAINAKAKTAQQNAIGSRDALAFFMAQQQRKTELTEENRANKRRLQEIDKALKQQTEAVIKRYNEQVAAARKAAQDAINIENQKLQILSQQLNAEIAAINQANQARLTLSQNYWNAQLATDTAGANASLSIVSQFWNGVLATLSGDGIQHSSPPIIPDVVPYDGSLTPNPDYSADYSALTVMQSQVNTDRIASESTRSAQTLSDGVVVNIDGLGMTDMQVIRRVQAELGRTLREARRRQQRAL